MKCKHMEIDGNYFAGSVTFAGTAPYSSHSDPYDSENGEFRCMLFISHIITNTNIYVYVYIYVYVSVYVYVTIYVCL